MRIPSCQTGKMMEIKNLYFAGHSHRVLELVEDGEVRLFMLSEIDLEAVLQAMPVGVSQAAQFRAVH